MVIDKNFFDEGKSELYPDNIGFEVKNYKGLVLSLIAEEIPLIGSFFDKFEAGKRVENLEKIRGIM